MYHIHYLSTMLYLQRFCLISIHAKADPIEDAAPRTMSPSAFTDAIEEFRNGDEQSESESDE